MLFRSSSKQQHGQAVSSGRADGFEYLSVEDVYLDAACQSLRPQPVIDALEEYYTSYGACGGRVKYAWGNRVDEAVSSVRRAVLDLLDASPRSHAAAFTLNTTYGLNLLLQQLPHGRFDRIVTSHIEHNSVYLSTITAAARLGIDRVVAERAPDGSVVIDESAFERAVVVVNAASNIDGRVIPDLAGLVSAVHRRGGIVIVDGAQAIAHSRDLIAGADADAVCFSGHKMYGASLGVVVATQELLNSLEVSFIGGGMVSDVTESGFELLPDEPWARLEPGLQAWGEIIALGAAVNWLTSVRPGGVSPADYLHGLETRLYEGLSSIPGLTVVNAQASPVISVYSEQLDAHQLAVFLSKAGVMVRSGYFCAHHYLKEKRGLPPLLRFSLGLHNTAADVDTAISRLSRLAGGLR